MTQTDCHQERSRLINDYKSQLRNLTKELKKKKLPQKQREEIEEKVATLELEHKQQLIAFDELHGIETKKKHAGDDDAEEAAEPESGTPVRGGDPHLKVRNWGGSSKKDLEECCIARGLSRKGTKEQLISRLTVWSTGNAGDPRALEESNTEIQYETFNPVNVVSAAKKDEFREKRKKLWKRRTAAPLREGPRETDETSSSSDDSDAEEGEDEGKQGRKSSASESEDDQQIVSEETLQKQRKREAVVRPILKRILEKYKDGVKLSEITEKLKEFKVANFTPQLLGYDSLEAWIEGQPRNVLTYKAKTQLILPTAVGAMPDSDDDDSDD